MPFRPARVTHLFGRIKERNGITGVRLHDLRHFMATQALTAGHDLRTVAGRLGHGSGGAVTLKVYSHFLAASDAKVADHMGQLLRPAD